MAKQYIPLIRPAGYDYAEVSLSKLYALPKHALFIYKSMFDSEGIPVEAFNNGVPPGVRLLGGADLCAQWKSYIERTLYLADYFGVSVITSSTPHRFEVPEGFSWEGCGKGQYVEFLRSFAEECQKHNLQFALEPICGEEQGFVRTLAQAGEIIELVGCDNVKIVPDFFHMRMEKDDRTALIDLVAKGRIGHIHYADPRLRGFPAGSRQQLYMDDLLPVMQAGYTGRISVEACSTNPAAEIPEAVRALGFLKRQ